MWVTWLPVSNNAVTGCPFITICSSLALPINLAQGSIDDLLLSANLFAPFSALASGWTDQMGNASLVLRAV